MSALTPWLDYVVANNASDLHLSAGSIPRVRVDGRLHPVPEAQPVVSDELEAMIDELLDDTRRAAFERDHQVDFSFDGSTSDRFRANAYVQSGRAALALRRIPATIPTLDEIGVPQVGRSFLSRDHGLVLVTGPTGSGKSTTLASMIDEINRTRPCHILSIEDPIEYVHQSDQALVSQRQVGTDTNSFEDALRAALREDPDVVLVGEMRDLETIALTLTLAETGHLVFASVHTNDAAQTIDRIIDVFPADQQSQIRTQLAMSLTGVISQRLLPKIGGGRLAAFEVLVGTTAARNLIRESKVRQIRNLLTTGQREGMCVLEQSLSALVSSGQVTLEAAAAVSVHPEDIAGYANTAGSGG